MKAVRNFALLAGALVAPFAAFAQGYQVQPMLATITPSGSGARLALSLKNSGAVPITLELIPFRATVDDAGTPTRTDETKDLMVYPDQTIIPPGKEQTVQVRYIGDPALLEARMYGVRVAQLPIDFKGTGVAKGGSTTSVMVSFNFLSHIIVTPATAVPVVTVSSDERAPAGDLKLLFLNSGKGIAILNDSKLTLTDAEGKSVTVDSSHIDIGKFSALMPNQSRRATIAAKDIASLSGAIKPSIILN
jgi:fimbrial chaperone protein